MSKNSGGTKTPPPLNVPKDRPQCEDYKDVLTYPILSVDGSQLMIDCSSPLLH